MLIRKCSSCYSALFRSCRRFPLDHPFLCTMAELASPTCRCVIGYLSLSLQAVYISSAITFVLAPLPNALFSHCGSDELSSSYESSPAVDLGRFITAMFVVTGFALPIVLAHSNVINAKACAMSIAGGGYVAHFPRLSVSLTLSMTQACIRYNFSLFRSIQTRRIGLRLNDFVLEMIL